MNHYEVTEINFVPVKPKDGLLGFVNLIINKDFHVGSIGVFLRPDGQDIRLAFPEKTIFTGAKIKYFLPLNPDLMSEMYDAIREKLAEIQTKVEGQQA